MLNYKKLFLLIIFNIQFLIFTSFAQNLTQYVNPMIGTGGHGHTFPGATLPFAMVQLSPDTRIDGSWDGCSGYHFSDSMIYGFSHTHLSGTGCSDYGDIAFLPILIPVQQFTKEKIESIEKNTAGISYNHKNEKAQAGYYSVLLDNKIKVELTTTKRAGLQRYTFTDDGLECCIRLDLTHRDELLEGSIHSQSKTHYSGIRRSKAWAKNQILFYDFEINKEPSSIKIVKGNNGEEKLFLVFKNIKKGDEILIKTGISGVDEAGAKNNLQKEMPTWDFEKYKQLAKDAWEKELAKIAISKLVNEPISKLANWEISELANKSISKLVNDSISKLKKRKTVHSSLSTVNHQLSTVNYPLSTINSLKIFYTALYHSMIHPSIFNDVDNRYRGRDNAIHNTEGKFDYYTVFSLWDTYRGLHPLLTMIDKKRTNDFINTFIKQYEQCGRLPVWELWGNETDCMIGYHAVSVIWDAYNKGIRDYDVNKAFEAMKSIATFKTDYTDVYGDLQMNENAKKRCANSEALLSYNKYGYVRADDDHESVSKTLEYAYDDWCIAQMAFALNKNVEYEYYKFRSNNWINVFDPTTGFMRARLNGTLYAPFSPYTVDNNYTEANSWQYSFYVPHDVNRLIYMQGGKEKMEQKLDDLFTAKEQTEGRTQADITGLIGQYAHGNEPSHQIAYLYNYIGKPQKAQEKINYILENFYKNEPDGLIGNEDCGQMSAWYVLNSLGIYQLCPGGDWIDSCKPLFNSNILKYTNNIITNPDKENEKNEFNYTNYFTENPFIINAKQSFKDSMNIIFENLNRYGNPKKLIYASVNDSDYFYLRDSNLIIKNKCKLKFYIEKDIEEKFYKSPIQTATFYKLPSDRTVSIKSIYNKSYSGGGAEALIDGIHGTTNWKKGNWQGYQAQDFEATILLDSIKNIHQIKTTFLQDQGAWIFFPTQVNYYTSIDNMNFTLLETINIDVPKQNENNEIKSINTKAFTKDIKAKYMKVVAKNYGKLPAWHPGVGGDAFIFVDEIEVN